MVVLSFLKGILHRGGSSEETALWEDYQTLGQPRRDELGGGRNNITFRFLVYVFFLQKNMKRFIFFISSDTLYFQGHPSNSGSSLCLWFS